MERTDLQLPDPDDALAWSVDGLADEFPHLSVKRVLSHRQKIGLIIAAGVVTALAVVAPRIVGTSIMAVLMLLYSAMLAFRLWLMWRRDDDDPTVFVTDSETAFFQEHKLPSFSVLVPLYDEPGVVAVLVDRLASIDYPPDRLDVHLVLESDDQATLDALALHDLPAHFSVIEVPPSEPRTKPKACNYALQFCTGNIVTIYDAEDRPEPLQLRRVALAFRRAGPEVACMQCELSFYNGDENIVTRWFLIDYHVWFTQFLPGLAASDTPIPLGGTSNHVRRSVLMEVGGWDPFNVTEDADLGVRLHRRGHRVGLVDSVTYEEANTDVVNWVKQRSRWYKGYLQTWLVHMRDPRALVAEVGLGGALRFNLFVGGTPILAAINPVMWTILMLWFVIEPAWIEAIMPGPVYFSGLTTWVVGNFIFYYLNLAAAYDTGRREVFRAAVLLPAYWVMMSLAAVKAVWQLVFDPNYWEKTAHGLSTVGPPSVDAPVGDGAT